MGIVMPCLACSANSGQVSIGMEALFIYLFIFKLYFECIGLCKLDQEYVFWDSYFYTSLGTLSVMSTSLKNLKEKSTLHLHFAQ